MTRIKTLMSRFKAALAVAAVLVLLGAGLLVWASAPDEVPAAPVGPTLPTVPADDIGPTVPRSIPQSPTTLLPSDDVPLDPIYPATEPAGASGGDEDVIGCRSATTGELVHLDGLDDEGLCLAQDNACWGTWGDCAPAGTVGAVGGHPICPLDRTDCHDVQRAQDYAVDTHGILDGCDKQCSHQSLANADTHFRVVEGLLKDDVLDRAMPQYRECSTFRCARDWTRRHLDSALANGRCVRDPDGFGSTDDCKYAMGYALALGNGLGCGSADCPLNSCCDPFPSGVGYSGGGEPPESCKPCKYSGCVSEVGCCIRGCCACSDELWVSHLAAAPQHHSCALCALGVITSDAALAWCETHCDDDAPAAARIAAQGCCAGLYGSLRARLLAWDAEHSSDLAAAAVAALDAGRPQQALGDVEAVVRQMSGGDEAVCEASAECSELEEIAFGLGDAVQTCR